MVRNREVPKSRIVRVNNVQQYVIIRFAAKLNGRTVERIMRRALISPHLRGLKRLVYGLLILARLARPLIGVKNTGELRSRCFETPFLCFCVRPCNAIFQYRLKGAMNLEIVLCKIHCYITDSQNELL